MIDIIRDIGLVSFTGNPMMLHVESLNHLDSNNNPRPFYTMFCEVFLQDPRNDSTIYETLSITPDQQGRGVFDLAPILKDLTKTEVPWPTSSIGQGAIQREEQIEFFFCLRDGYGTPFSLKDRVYVSERYYARPGGFTDSILEEIEKGGSNCYEFLKANKIFLTSIPNKKKTYPSQTELLKFYNTLDYYGPAEYFRLRIKEHLWDGTSKSTRGVYYQSINRLSSCTFDVTPNKLDLDPNTVWWEMWVTLGDSVVSETVSYSRNETKPTNARQFLFRNSLGGYDTVVATGSRTITTEGTTQQGFIAKQSAVRKWLVPTQTRRKSTNVYRGILGYFDNEELNWLKELFNSEEKYLVENNKLEPITIRTVEWPSNVDEGPGKIEIEAEIGSPFSFFF